MQDLVGIIRTESELQQALVVLQSLKARLAGVTVQGNRQFNPGWHLTLDLHNMLLVAEAATRSAIERKESRGGHTRDDFPDADPEWGKVNVVTRLRGNELALTREPLPAMPAELQQLFEEHH
jgi:succinate dehydrogenase / fumarate reductase flavoprotein subunit